MSRAGRVFPEIVNVPGDGNCFFYALFWAALTSGKFNELAACMPIGEDHTCLNSIDPSGSVLPTQTQITEFVTCMRESLAVKIDNDNTSIRAIFTEFANMTDHGVYTSSDGPEYKATVMKWCTRSKPGWNFERNFIGFRSAVAEYIRQPFAWVEALHVGAIQRMLEKCGSIRLQVLWDEEQVSKLLHTREEDVLYVHHARLHYHYVDFGDNRRFRFARTREASFRSDNARLPRGSNTNVENTQLQSTLQMSRAHQRGNIQQAMRASLLNSYTKKAMAESLLNTQTKQAMAASLLNSGKKKTTIHSGAAKRNAGLQMAPSHRGSKTVQDQTTRQAMMRVSLLNSDTKKAIAASLVNSDTRKAIAASLANSHVMMRRNTYV